MRFSQQHVENQNPSIKFCENSTTYSEHTLKRNRLKIDSAFEISFSCNKCTLGIFMVTAFPFKNVTLKEGLRFAGANETLMN